MTDSMRCRVSSFHPIAPLVLVEDQSSEYSCANESTLGIRVQSVHLPKCIESFSEHQVLRLLGAMNKQQQ